VALGLFGLRFERKSGIFLKEKKYDTCEKEYDTYVFLERK